MFVSFRTVEGQSAYYIPEMKKLRDVVYDEVPMRSYQYHPDDRYYTVRGGRIYFQPAPTGEVRVDISYVPKEGICA